MYDRVLSTSRGDGNTSEPVTPRCTGITGGVNGDANVTVGLRSELIVTNTPDPGLPYELVPPSHAHDLWALGLILFRMATGRELVPIDDIGDAIDGDAMLDVMMYGASQQAASALSALIAESVEATDTRQLLGILLHPNPIARRTVDLSKLLHVHPFFVSKPTANTRHSERERLDHLESFLDSHVGHLVGLGPSRIDRAASRAAAALVIPELMDVTARSVPTTCLVLPYDKRVRDEALTHLTGDTSSSEIELTFFQSLFGVLEAATQAVTSANIDESYPYTHDLLFKDFDTDISGVNVSTEADSFRILVADWCLKHENSFFFYYIDELSGDVVKGEGNAAALRITIPALWIAKLLPLIYTSLVFMTATKGPDFVVSLFLPSFPVSDVARQSVVSLLSHVEKQRAHLAFDTIVRKSLGVPIDDTLKKEKVKMSVMELRRVPIDHLYSFIDVHDYHSSQLGLEPQYVHVAAVGPSFLLWTRAQSAHDVDMLLKDTAGDTRSNSNGTSPGAPQPARSARGTDHSSSVVERFRGLGRAATAPISASRVEEEAHDHEEYIQTLQRILEQNERTTNARINDIKESHATVVNKLEEKIAFLERQLKRPWVCF
mgnify:CR=1 FL=1